MSKLDSSIREEKIRYDRINNYLNNYIERSNVKAISKESISIFVEKYLVGESRTTLYNNISALNKILEERGIDIEVDSSDHVDNVKFNSEKYFSKVEIQQVCNVFQNAQDKFIVYALFNGIMGKDYQDLLTLKVSDVAEDYSYINVGDRRVACDDYMKQVLKRTIETDYYTKHAVSENNRNPEYSLNMDSPYIIKVKSYKKNNNGLDPMNKAGIQTRLRRISDMFSKKGMDIHLTGKSLERSGIMFDMFMKESKEQVEWTIENIKKWFEKENIKGNIAEIYRTYHQKYHSNQ